MWPARPGTARDRALRTPTSISRSLRTPMHTRGLRCGSLKYLWYSCVAAPCSRGASAPSLTTYSRWSPNTGFSTYQKPKPRDPSPPHNPHPVPPFTTYCGTPSSASAASISGAQPRFTNKRVELGCGTTPKTTPARGPIIATARGLGILDLTGDTFGVGKRCLLSSPDTETPPKAGR